MNQTQDTRTTLYRERDASECEIHSLSRGQVAVYSRKSPDKDGPNEDAALVSALGEGRGVLAVADGMGGAPAGERAAACALEQLDTAISKGTGAGKDLRDSILDGFERANRSVNAIGLGAGTTLAVLEIDGNRVRSYHVGDSQLLLVGQRGKLKHQSLSHSPIGYAVEAGVMDEEEAIVHEDRHLISNAIGMPDMKIEIGSVLELATRDTLVLASDGLFDNLRIEEITEAIRVGSLREACARLEAQCRKRMLAEDETQPGKPDDLTFLLFRPHRDR